MVNSTLIKHLIWRISRDDLSDNYNVNNELLFASCIRTRTVHETCTDSTVHLQPLNSNSLRATLIHTAAAMVEIWMSEHRCCHTQLKEGWESKGGEEDREKTPRAD